MNNGYKVIIGQPNHGRLHAHFGTHRGCFPKRECRTKVGWQRQAPLLERFVQDTDALKKLGLRLVVCHGRIESVVGAGLELREEKVPGIHGYGLIAEVGDNMRLNVLVLHHGVVRGQRKVAVEICETRGLACADTEVFVEGVTSPKEVAEMAGHIILVIDLRG
jgi:hypothetical protein